MKQSTKNIILGLASKKGQIVYGQRAVNQQVPTYLKRKTKDYDIYSKKPEIAAMELVKKLKNGDYEVIKAKYGRTWRVKDKKTGEVIVDYTQPSRYPKTKTILGVKYAHTDSAKRKIKKILRDEGSKYRWEKDKEMLRRIKRGEAMPW